MDGTDACDRQDNNMPIPWWSGGLGSLGPGTDLDLTIRCNQYDEVMVTESIIWQDCNGRNSNMVHPLLGFWDIKADCFTTPSFPVFLPRAETTTDNISTPRHSASHSPAAVLRRQGPTGR